MVTRRVITVSALGEIDGIGKARVEKYSDTFLQLLIHAFDVGLGHSDEKNSAHPE